MLLKSYRNINMLSLDMAGLNIYHNVEIMLIVIRRMIAS